MAVIADLKIKIGANIAELERSLNRATSRLERFGNDIRRTSFKIRREAERIASAGTAMTAAFTVPLTGLGITAIKQAANLERLSIALETTMGSAAAAKQEFDRLREAAKNPGLNFEQAVKGSIRLQAVGFDAETARRALLAFGNAITLAGGTAQDLDGVTLALTQIASKGVVSAEEINQIAERVPQIRAAMQAAFGTADTEAIQKMGLEAKQFVSLIIEEFEKMPKAAGGLANSIENAAANIRLSLAQLGAEIAKSLDVEDVLNKVATAISSVAQWFASLSDSTKRTTLQIAGLAAATGPLLIAYSAMRKMQAFVYEQLGSMIKGFVSLTRTVQAARKAFLAMNLAMKLSVAGAAAAAIAGLVLAIKSFTKETEAARLAAESANKIEQRSAEIAAEKLAKLNVLVATIKDTTRETRDRKRALEELQSIAPQYFKNLSLEKSSIEEITKASERYREEILKRARVQAIQERIVELERQRLELEQGNAQNLLSITDKLRIAASALLSPVSAAMKAGELGAQRYKEQVSAVDAEIDRLISSLQELQDATATVEVKTTQQRTSVISSKVEAPTVQLPEVSERQLVAPLEALQQTLLKTIDYTNIAKKTLVEFATDPSWQQTLQLNMTTFKQSVVDSTQAIEMLQQSTSALGLILGNAFGAMIEEINRGTSSLKQFGLAAVQAILKTVRALAMQAIAKWISKTLTTTGGLGIGAIALIAAGATALGAIINKAFASVRVPSLAQGGIAYSPTLALVGDNPISPEVIAPLHELQGLMNTNDVKVSGQVRIDGRDLVIVFDRTRQEMTRYGAKI